MQGGLEELRRRIETIVRKVCPRSMAADVDDLVQAATLKIWDKAGSEGIEGLNSSYLWKVAHSVLIDEIRRVRRRKETALEDREPTLATRSGDGPVEYTQHSQASRALQDCLSRLVDPRRRAVTAYLLGHTVPDTARMLGWNLKKAESLVYRGLKQLRQCMQAKGLKP